MAGPTGFEQLSDPHGAVVYMTPPNSEAAFAPNREPFFTPEINGKIYDVHNPIEAEAYLTEVHNRDLPSIRGEFDASTGYHLASAIQKEKRAAIYENGENENVAEHSFFLSTSATLTAVKAERKDLDPGKVSIMSNFHDLIVEAYGGDTPIHDDEALASKEYREAAGLTLFLNDVGNNYVSELMLEYEEGRTPEARFVKAMDKVVAYQFSLATKAHLHKVREESFEDVVANALPKVAIDNTAFEMMKGVLKALGRKWVEWGCVEFYGEADEIVDNIALFIKDQGAEVIRLPRFIPDESTVTTQEIEKPGDLLRFPLKGLVEVVPEADRQVIDPAVLNLMGVSVLEAMRDNHKPTPPNPPSPSTMALAA